MTSEDNQHRRLNLPPKLDVHTEGQLEYLCRTNLKNAWHLIEHWEGLGYDMDGLKQIYATYELEYLHNNKRGF